MKSSMKSGDKETLLFVRNLHAAVRKKKLMSEWISMMPGDQSDHFYRENNDKTPLSSINKAEEKILLLKKRLS